MNVSDERQQNQTVYRQLKNSIDKTYATGRFVAIAGGKVIADAPRFDELDALLHQQGHHSADLLVVQAGADYPETVTIFA